MSPSGTYNPALNAFSGGIIVKTTALKVADIARNFGKAVENSDIGFEDKSKITAAIVIYAEEMNLLSTIEDTIIREF
ncbi:MAG: hypothetical protein AAF478_14045 [Pseudomonadota bacterium]